MGHLYRYFAGSERVSKTGVNGQILQVGLCTAVNSP
jgi:hypothetical protein